MLNLEVSGLHLNYDAVNDNGIIVNSQYPNGALFTETKPLLPMDYIQFEYTEKGDLRQYNYIEVLVNEDGLQYTERRPIAGDLEAAIKALASAWIQPLGQEGNPSPEQIEAGVRQHRDMLLFQCDWTQMADAPLSAAKKKEWKEYRAALRDITEQPGFPSEVIWPQEPAK